MINVDKVIIGAGLYGLYAALHCGKRKENVVVLEVDSEPFSRATYINQARVHKGYHYPRSLSTAQKSANYFDRFNNDFGFCINKEFKKIYATSKEYSWTSGEQFVKFCHSANIPCETIDPKTYFKEELCDGAFLTNEYTYDARILRDYYLDEIAKYSNIRIVYNSKISKIEKDDIFYSVITNDVFYQTKYVLNSTYSGVNQILEMAGFEKFKIKYELCEIILCNVNEKLKDVGITVMDGPFFSIMPFGKTGLHSLTSVTFTPHSTCYDELPSFQCQTKEGSDCTKYALGNCNLCPNKPKTAFPYMSSLARKYLNENLEFDYKDSLYSIKPILMSSEIDDSRPTVIRVHSKNPTFVSVLSGKINTVYDLDEVLDEK